MQKVGSGSGTIAIFATAFFMLIGLRQLGGEHAKGRGYEQKMHEKFKMRNDVAMRQRSKGAETTLAYRAKQQAFLLSPHSTERMTSVPLSLFLSLPTLHIYCRRMGRVGPKQFKTAVCAVPAELDAIMQLPQESKRWRVPGFQVK